MPETDKERSAVKPANKTFDESKLTPPQREALAIAKAQGVKPIQSIDDLIAIGLDLTPEESEQFHTVLMDLRKADRARPRKTYDFDDDAG